MPRSQTPTPKQRAQDAVDKADAALSKKREKLARLAERANKAKAVFDAARQEHSALQEVIAYEQRHRDLLASHPLLNDGQIPGQTSIDDFHPPVSDEDADAQADLEVFHQEAAEQEAEQFEAERVTEIRSGTGITVRDNPRPAGKRLFAAAPASDDEAVTPVPQETDEEDVFQVPAEEPKDDNPPFVL